ncbi:MAG: hypothetical protein IPJ06_05320 [Saprospiraceae bacterium]|nr:hypothetical protein [Saprospiraceae bacterium]
MNQKPADITVECDQVIAVPTITATDNCDLNATVTYATAITPGNCAGNYVETRTLDSVGQL